MARSRPASRMQNVLVWVYPDGTRIRCGPASVELQDETPRCRPLRHAASPTSERHHRRLRERAAQLAAQLVMAVKSEMPVLL